MRAKETKLVVKLNLVSEVLVLEVFLQILLQLESVILAAHSRALARDLDLDRQGHQLKALLGNKVLV